jgi:hypothetical protein
MTRPRDPRARPIPRTPEEEAEIEAKYQDLFEKLRVFHARIKAREGGGGSPLAGELSGGD